MAKQPQKPPEKKPPESGMAPTIAKSTEEDLAALREAADLGRKLVAMLSSVVGDGGASESAEECLARVLKERAGLRQLVGVERAHRDGDHAYTVAIEAKMEEELDTLRARVQGLESERAELMAESAVSSARAAELVNALPVKDRIPLLGDLLALLAPHAGETGRKEAAGDVLRRKITEGAATRNELEALQKKYDALTAHWSAAQAEVAALQNAMVSKRSPEAAAEIAMDHLGMMLYEPAMLLGFDEKAPLARVLEQVIREWVGLREFLSQRPLVAVAVRDDSTAALKERYSLILMEWDGKRLSPSVLEGPARPFSEIVRLMRQTVDTRLVPAHFR